MASPRKRIDDLPHFSIRSFETERSRDAESVFSLLGVLDTLQGVRRGRCWLLVPERQHLIGDLELLDRSTCTASFRGSGPAVPSVGASFAYLNGYWQARQLWMVNGPHSAWQKLVFQASDAVADSIEGTDGKKWRRLRKETAAESAAGGSQVVRGGWSHEHCDLCRAHIDPGGTGYRHESNYWVCESCYEKYAKTNDLSFVDEL
jgi:hypothetical protein